MILYHMTLRNLPLFVRRSIISDGLTNNLSIGQLLSGCVVPVVVVIKPANTGSTKLTIYNSFCFFVAVLSHTKCLFLYPPFCHGALNLDPIYIVCNMFFFEQLFNLDYANFFTSPWVFSNYETKRIHWANLINGYQNSGCSHFPVNNITTGKNHFHRHQCLVCKQSCGRQCNNGISGK